MKGSRQVHWLWQAETVAQTGTTQEVPATAAIFQGRRSFWRFHERTDCLCCVWRAKRRENTPVAPSVQRKRQDIPYSTRNGSIFFEFCGASRLLNGTDSTDSTFLLFFTAPIATQDASISTIKCVSKLGKANNDGDVSLLLDVSNASISSVQLKFLYYVRSGLKSSKNDCEILDKEAVIPS